jgi:hypothetical protein
MGSTFEAVQFGRSTTEVLKTRYKRYIEEAELLYGNDPYSGTLSTCCGLNITTLIFDTNEQAEGRIMETHEKRDAAMAVQVREPELHWLIGGWCAT